jgi:ribonuclease Z
VWKNRLAEMGLEPGPWLAELKRAVAENLPEDTRIRGWTLGELKARALAIAPGQKICYITDIPYHAENEARAARAKTVIPFHFSPRYEGREAELVAELEASRSAT